MKIDLSLLTGKLQEIAKFADENSQNSNGKYLDNSTEISLFFNEAQKAVQNGEITQKEVNAIFGLEKGKSKTRSANSKLDEEVKRIYTEKLSDSEKTDVTSQTQNSTNEEFLDLSHKLDQTLIQNEITGTGAILNRVYRYDLDSIADRYVTLQNRFNKAEYDVENWFKDPESTMPEMVEKHLFEDNIKSVLGMSIDEYKEKFVDILPKIAALPPKTTTASILLHLETVAKFNEEEKLVYNDIVTLNRVLSTNFNAWENDIMYKSIDISSEANMEVMENLNVVSDNEYAESSEFKMPQNWLVRKNFIKAIEDISGELLDIKNVQNNNKTTQTKKYVKDGKVIIEKTMPNDDVKYFDAFGIEVNI